MNPLLAVRDLAVRLGAVVPVDGVDLDVRPGEVLGIVGESGAGKSLLLRAILRLLPPGADATGTITWGHQDLLTLPEAELAKIRGAEIAMVFQEPMTALNPVLSIGLQITETLLTHRGLRGTAARRRATELLDLVGIPDANRRLQNYPHEFSGGMRQRAMIAIALAGQPKLLLADEPTTALDVTIQDQILKLLLSLAENLAMSLVIVTHDLGVIASTCERVAVMYAGRVMEVGPIGSVLLHPAHAYTRGLLRSLGAENPRRRLQGIEGAPPAPGTVQTGCRFSPRCGFAIDACRTAAMPLQPISANWFSACIRADAVRTVP
jgi:peptide/nickel transport system ATP-binding protein/oligopeptide transport system ATP-binding protein